MHNCLFIPHSTALTLITSIAGLQSRPTNSTIQAAIIILMAEVGTVIALLEPFIKDFNTEVLIRITDNKFSKNLLNLFLVIVKLQSIISGNDMLNTICN